MKRLMRVAAPAIVVMALLAFVPTAFADIVVNRSDDPDNTVGNCETSGSCSLREAVNAANALAGAHTITFTVATVHVTSGPSAGGVVSAFPLTIDGGSGVTIVGDSGSNILVFNNGSASAISNTLKNVTIDGHAISSANGGPGVFVTTANGPDTTTLDHVTVFGLTGQNGGGGTEVTGNSTINIVDSTIRDNSATGGRGGGLLVGSGSSASVVRSTFSGNQAVGQLAGAIDIENGAAAVSIVNSTFSGNSAVDGGAIYDLAGVLKLSFSTISGNASTSGATAAALNLGGFTTQKLKGNILNDPASAKECSGAFASGGFNFFPGTSCGSAANDHPNTAISLGALQNNGGPTFTQAPASGSPSIDAIPSASCSDVDATALSVDQRGVSRPKGTACDAGAVEAAPPVNSAAPTISGTPAIGQTLTCDPGTWSGSPTFTFQWLNDGSAIAGATGTSYNVAASDGGHQLVCRV